MADQKLDGQALKEKVGKHLRTADDFTRYQRYEEALMELDHAIQLDPKNKYARSFAERVKMLLKRSQESSSVKEDTADHTLEARMAVVAQHLSHAEEHINAKDYKGALEEIAKVYKIDPTNYYAQAYSDRIDTLMREETQVNEKAFPHPAAKQEEVQHAAPQQEKGSMLMYRELLKQVWMDGKITEQEAEEMANMRETFGITVKEHELAEKEVKIQAYVEALRIAWRDNTITEIESKVLQAMRERYLISDEEEKIAEKRFNELRRQTKSKGIVLLVDPDRANLIALNKLLKTHGYSIFLAQRVEDAFQILQTQTPALVIAEAFFPAGQIDGLGLFKRMSEHPMLKLTPFFLMSAITDQKIIHAAYRLGIDQFVVKPIDHELLAALVEGRTL